VTQCDVVVYIWSNIFQAKCIRLQSRGSSALRGTRDMSLKRSAAKPGWSILQLSSGWCLHHPAQLEPPCEGTVRVYSIFTLMGNWCHPRIKSGCRLDVCL